MPTTVSWNRLLTERRLYLLIALSVLAVTLAYQRSDAYQIELGTSRDDAYLEGFYNPERNAAGPFRWTSARADVRLPNLWPAQPVRLTLTLSAPRPSGQGQVPVALRVNDRALDTPAIGAVPRTLVYDLDANTLGTSGSLNLIIQSPTFAPPTDMRELGVTVSRIELTPLGSGPYLPSLPVLAVVTAIVVLGYLWLRRLSVSHGAALGVALLAMTVAALGLWFVRLLVTLYAAQFLYALIVPFAASEAVRWLTRDQQTTNTAASSIARWTAALLLAAFAIRMILAHAPGDPANFIAFKMMIAQVAQHGLASIYALDPVVGAYPPVHHYDWALISFLYRAFVSPDFALDSLRLNFLMKMPTITLDMLITVILMAYAIRHSARASLLAGAAYALNPGIIYVSAYNGQLGDPLYSLFITTAVVALLVESAAGFGASAALALLTKPQAGAFLPFFVVAGLRCLPELNRTAKAGRREENIKPDFYTSNRPHSGQVLRAIVFSPDVQRAIVAGAITTLLILLPFILAGTVGQMLHTVSTTIGHGPRLSANAYNFWWLVGWGNAWDIADTGLLFGPLSYRTIGLLLLFAAANGLIAWKLWSHSEPRALTMLTGFAGLSFFMLPTEIHENYLFPTIPLLVLFAVHERRAWLLWAVLSVTWFINLVFVDIGLREILDTWGPWMSAAIFPTQVVVSLLNIGVYLVWGWWGIRLGSEAKN